MKVSQSAALIALLSLAACGGGSMNSAIPGSRTVESSAQAAAQSSRSAAEAERSNDGDRGGDNDGGRVSNTFDTFNLGPAAGQNGWLGSACGYSLSHIDAATTYPNAHFSGTNRPSKVLVVQNATADGCYNGLGSPPLAKPAGKETSFTVPFPTWTVCGEACVKQYSAQWTITSSTGGYQPGIGMSLSPVYNNDGARMAYVGMEFVLNPHNNKPSLHIFTYDVRGVCPPGSTINDCGNPGPAPCYQCANFVYHDVKYIDPTKEHTLGVTMDFAPRRDRVVVTVDGEEAWTGTSWSDYYTMDTESDPLGAHPQSRAVNDLLLHGNGSNGVGFLYRNVTVATR